MTQKKGIKKIIRNPLKENQFEKKKQVISCIQKYKEKRVEIATIFFC